MLQTGYPVGCLSILDSSAIKNKLIKPSWNVILITHIALAKKCISTLQKKTKPACSYSSQSRTSEKHLVHYYQKIQPRVTVLLNLKPLQRRLMLWQQESWKATSTLLQIHVAVAVLFLYCQIHTTFFQWPIRNIWLQIQPLCFTKKS